MVKRRKKIFLLCIGSELLKGEVLNSNVTFLGRILFENGFELVGERSCSDDERQIHAALKEAFEISDCVITSGGLGPTFDDVTREIISKYFRTPLEFSKSHYQNLIHRMSKGRKLSNTLRDGYHIQSFFPRGSRIISNRLGSASGFLIESQSKKVISLPGVPREFESMISEEILAGHLLNGYRLNESDSLIAKAVGINEVEFLKRLGPLPDSNEIQCGIYPNLGEVRFTAIALDDGEKTKQRMRDLNSRLEKNLIKFIYSFDRDETLEEVVGRFLKRNKKTVSIAESCTGGLTAKFLTDISGSSKYFVGGITAYSDRVKADIVGVPKIEIRKHGAVSLRVAASLAKNVRKIMNTSYGIGITGIAGPDGGSKTKPVGLVYIGLSDQRSVMTRKFIFKGDRTRIRTLASKWALHLLWQKTKFGHF